MKLEVRCTQCGKGFLLDEGTIAASGGALPCPACGAAIRLAAVAPAPPRASAPAPAPPSVAPAPPSEVCCPRCGLHFVPSAESAASAGSRPTVLLVEDMDYFVEIARDALGGRYELKVAQRVDEARALLARGGVDLLLLDLTLEGGQDGLSLLRGWRKSCPVLLFTAQDESEMYGDGWSKMRELGIDDVVIKGMNMGEILARKVAALLGEPQKESTYR